MEVNFYVPNTTMDAFTLFMIIIPIILVGVFYFMDPFDIKKNYKLGFNLFILITLFSLFSLYLLKSTKYPNKDSGGGVEAESLMKKLTLTLGTLIGAIYLAVFLFKKLSGMKNLYSFLKFIGQAILVIGALAIVYLAFTTLKESDNIIMKTIFYIPCLFIEFADYLKEQFKITSSKVWIILGIEAFIILLMYIIPIISQYIINKNTYLLLKDPVYLNKKYSLATFDDLNKDIDKEKYQDKKYAYSISAWYYINPQPPNTSSAYNNWTPLLSYSNKPVLEYYGLTNTLRVRTEVPSDKEDSAKQNILADVYSTNDIDFQKWNNIVFNYDGASLDIFSNGELVATHSNISPFMATDNIVVGAKNGIHGGICNVKYYSDYLQKSDIKNTYNLLKTLNPPLF